MLPPARKFATDKQNSLCRIPKEGAKIRKQINFLNVANLFFADVKTGIGKLKMVFSTQLTEAE